MTQKEFDEKSDAAFYENITLGLVIILGLLGLVFVGSGFAHIADNTGDAIFRFAFGGALAIGAGKMIYDRFPEAGPVCKAMFKECCAAIAAYFGLIGQVAKNLAKLLKGGADAD